MKVYLTQINMIKLNIKKHNMKRILSHNKIILCIAILIIPLSSYANFLNKKIVLFPLKKTELASIVDSTIKKFNFKVGEAFKENDILVQMDKDLYQQLYLKAKADVIRTNASYKYTKSLYENNKLLFKKDAVGEQELEESKLNMIKALAENEQAKANFKIAELKLNSCSIKAPFAGRVIADIENEYDYVREGQPIIEVADDNQLLAVINLPSETIKTIKIGTPLEFRIDELGEDVSGKVYSISGAIDPGSRTFEVKAIINNNDGKLRVGMSGTLISKI